MIDVAEGSRKTSYLLGIVKEATTVNITSQSVTNDHIPAEDTQKGKDGQVKSTKPLRTITYILRMHRKAKKIRSTSHSCRE